MNDLHHFYTTRKNEFAQKCESIQKRIRQVVLIRIAIGLGFFFVAYLGFTSTTWWYLLIPSAIGFGFFVSRHVRLKESLDLHSNLMKLNELELTALDHEYSSFPEGAGFLDPHHAYSYDLDLFGPGSLYQYLNRCGTAVGANQLARDLQSPNSRRGSLSKDRKLLMSCLKRFHCANGSGRKAVCFTMTSMKIRIYLIGLLRAIL